MRLRSLLIVVLLAVFLPASVLAAVMPLPADLNGDLDGQPYRIRVPANWNGTLLVYSYGMAEGYDLVPLTPLGKNTPGPDERMLLDKGYALAGIRAAGWVVIPGGMATAGWNMKERIQSQVALASLFRDTVGQPLRTITWGKSMGGLVALALIEKHPGLFDGAVPLCAPAAGTARVYDQKLDTLLAFKAAFGWKDAWGTPAALRPDLNVMTEVYPYLLQQETDWPTALWAWEFVRMVNHIPFDPSFHADLYQIPMLPYRYQVLWLAFAPLPDIERRAGGRAVQNAGKVYSLTSEQIAQLQAMGRDPEPLLQQMNGEVESSPITAERNARNYVEHYYTPTGRITRPVLTLHTTGDATTIAQNQRVYFELVNERGNDWLLMQQFSLGNGVVNTHCTFLPAQFLAAIDAMVWWLDTGEKPDPEVYFPAAAGFDPGFVPGDWPR